VRDVSGAVVPLDLVVSSADQANINLANGALEITRPALLATSSPANRLRDAIKLAKAMTVEAWITPASTNDNGLARIVTFSNGPTTRYFTLGQIGNRYHFGLRATATNVNASDKALSAGPAATKLAHLVCTRDATGLTVIYLDGVEISRRTVAGDFASWNDGFKLALGNEPNSTDGLDRAWRGKFHLAAIYDRALNADEVKQNFDFGADANLPPFITAGADELALWRDPDTQVDWKINNLTQKVKGVIKTLQGRVVHDRLPGQGNAISWQQVSGPPDGVSFEDPSNPATRALFKEKGRYVLRLTADDGEITASDEVTITVHRPPRVEIRHVQSAQVIVKSTPNAPLELSAALLANEAAVQIQLSALLLDSGLGAEGTPAFQWTGPAGAIPSPVNQASTIVSFTDKGVFNLVSTVNNGQLSTTLPVRVTINKTPQLGGINDRTITLPLQSVSLQGNLINSGLGQPQTGAAGLNILWEPLNAPRGGRATPSPSDQLQTNTTFTAGGVYELRLTASNPDHPQLRASQTVSIRVNQPPFVSIRTIRHPASGGTILDVTVSDDGLPESPGVVTLTWEKLEGPGDVTFNSEAPGYTLATFTAQGTYKLRLRVGDSTAETISEIVVSTN
jgi:hypothetical protein